MAEFNAMDWLAVNRQRDVDAEKRFEDQRADFAEASAARDALWSGGNLQQATQMGREARARFVDPMYELKKAETQTKILATAANAADNIRSLEIRNMQFAEEQEDANKFQSIVKAANGDRKKILELLNSTFFKSPRGIQNATQARIQISELMDMDETSKLWSQMPWDVKAQLAGLERGSPQWMAKVRELALAKDVVKDIKPKSTTVLMPDGRKINAIYNPNTGSYDVIKTDAESRAEVERKTVEKELSNLRIARRAAEAAFSKARQKHVGAVASKQNAKDIAGLRAVEDDAWTSLNGILQQIQSLESKLEAPPAPPVTVPGENNQNQGSTNAPDSDPLRLRTPAELDAILKRQPASP